MRLCRCFQGNALESRWGVGVVMSSAVGGLVDTCDGSFVGSVVGIENDVSTGSGVE